MSDYCYTCARCGELVVFSGHKCKPPQDGAEKMRNLEGFLRNWGVESSPLPARESEEQ